MNSPMLSQHTNAALVRLKHTLNALEFGNIFKDLLERNEGIEQITEITEQRIDNGDYVLTDDLTRIFLVAKSPTLYTKVRKQLFLDDWSLLTLYKGRYPDAEIEERLCNRIYETSSDDEEPRRRYIADAMREVGTKYVLPTLEAILFDLKPTVQVKRIFADALKGTSDETPQQFSHQSQGALYRLEASSRAKFLESVALAIDAIKSRIINSSEAVGDDTQSEVSTRVDETSNAERAKEQARRYIDDDPKLAIILLRMGAEALGKDLYRQLGCEGKGKPARKMTLEELLKPVRDSDAPEVFKLILQALQLFGNFAAHDQDEQWKYLTREIASAVLALYEEAQTIYGDWSKLRQQ